MNNLTQEELNEELVDACRLDYPVEMIKLLIEEGADVNARDEWDITPLYYASREGRLEVVKYLVELGADVNVRNRSNNTPLHIASYYIHQEVVKYLKSKGGTK